MSEDILTLARRWFSVRYWAALHFDFYDAAVEQTAYAAIVEGRDNDLRVVISEVCDSCGFSPDVIKWVKPKTKNPKNESGTYAHTREVYFNLAAERYRPMAYIN